MPTPQQRGSLGGHIRWSRTVNRSAATRPAREKSPASVAYWLDKLGPEFNEATDAQRHAAAESAKKAYYARLSLRGVQARRGKAGAA